MQVRMGDRPLPDSLGSGIIFGEIVFAINGVGPETDNMFPTMLYRTLPCLRNAGYVMLQCGFSPAEGNKTG